MTTPRRPMPRRAALAGRGRRHGRWQFVRRARLMPGCVRFAMALAARWRRRRAMTPSALAAEVRRRAKPQVTSLRPTVSVALRLDLVAPRQTLPSLQQVTGNVRPSRQNRRLAVDRVVTFGVAERHGSAAHRDLREPALRSHRPIDRPHVPGNQVMHAVIRPPASPALGRSYRPVGPGVGSAAAVGIPLRRWRPRNDLGSAAVAHPAGRPIERGRQSIGRSPDVAPVSPGADLTVALERAAAVVPRARKERLAVARPWFHDQQSLSVRPLAEGAPFAIAGRTRRVERVVAAARLAVAPSIPAALWDSGRPVEPIARTKGPKPARAVPAPPMPALDEVERAITANVERHLDRKISAAVRSTLAADSDVSRVMTDRVCGDLYHRMVLERERLR